MYPPLTVNNINLGNTILRLHGAKGQGVDLFC